jgi:hypothetical protein
MSELGERRWAVISERGREASSLTHAEARALLGKLDAQKVHGTCVVTDDAASRLAPVPASGPTARPGPAGTRGKV